MSDTWDSEAKTFVKPDDKRPLPRLRHALETAWGKHATSEDDFPPVRVDFEGSRNRIVITTTEYRLREFMRAVSAVAHKWRTGQLDVPTIGVKEHKAMAEHGIKLRKDGLFGYRLKCARAACEKEVQTCYAALSIEEAIEDRNERRSVWVCGTECVILEHGIEDTLQPDFLNTCRDADAGSVYERVRIALGGIKETDEDGLSFVDGDVTDLQEKDPALWADLIVKLEEDADTDGSGKDAGEVTCEV